MARYWLAWRTVVWVLAVAGIPFFPACSDNDGDGIVGPGSAYWASLYDWSDGDTWTDPAQWPDDKLRSFAYSGSRGHPDFYQEDYGRGSPYYENTISTGLASDRWSELATSTRDSALTWSETSALSSSTYRDLVSESETDKYFEFRRVYAANPSDVLLSRVHKSSYLIRSMYDSFQPSAVLGTYRVRPIDESGARELIEYMWVNSRIVDFGKPLSRGLDEFATSFIEEIYYCSTSGGDWGTCDTIMLGRALVAVNKTTGEVSREVEELREINGVCYE